MSRDTQTGMGPCALLPQIPFLLLSLLLVPHPIASQTTDTTDPTNNVTAPSPAPGCGAGLDPVYSHLCDLQAVWGVVVEAVASLGFLVAAGLFLGLVAWAMWTCIPLRRRRGVGAAVTTLLLFLVGAGGVLGLTFATVIRLTPQTCPTRVFLFGVLFALCFSALLSRALALLGFAVARGWSEPVAVLGLWAVQVVIATEWLIVVLVRDGLPCAYSQAEFAMLLIYVLVLLAAALLVSLWSLCRTCGTYSYSYGGPGQGRARLQASLLFLTALLSAGIWVVWIALLTRGNPEMGRRPQWDDPVLSVALAANGWVLLLGHALPQLCFLCRGESWMKEGPLDFAGWASPTSGITTLGRDNGTFQSDTQDKRGKGQEPVLCSPYDFSMAEIDPDKDYSIPRPQTTNIADPYDEYYGPPV
ncbi:G-protein coupled receptor family C group 5 member D isoform X1 [Conger conger]|uniref:G-protein coupled receptor family C group 5 member D isoform X1 n=1 Tax=Conger conger TaxID=82655 RepID=UPI002A59BF6F|nr:G-protein coupled receptor family C group 5 member D isoform X1 [Conger conger]